MVAERRRRELAGDTAGQGTKASLDTMKKRYSHTASNTVGSRGSIIRAKARHGANQNRTRPTILSRDSWKEWQSCWGRRPPREKPKMLKPIPLYVASSNDNQGNRRILPRRTTIPRRGRFIINPGSFRFAPTTSLPRKWVSRSTQTICLARASLPFCVC